MNNIIVQAFHTKECIKSIYKVSNKNEYWLIVEDLYDKKALECYDLYYDMLLNEEFYFDIKLITMKDLENLNHYNYIKIY